MNIQEHKHRLHNDLCKGNTICAFTCCVTKKGHLFISQNIFIEFEKILLEALVKHESTAHIYLFMPDHVHLLLEGRTKDSDLLKALKLFKQKTGYFLSQNNSTFKWQKDFYDHILRHDEDLIKQVTYILNNPVRAGLVEDWSDYPYKGSMLYDLNNFDSMQPHAG